MLTLGLAALGLSSCGQPSGGASVDGPKTLKVVTTTTMITDLVQRVGGAEVQVTGLMGPGVDPHLYKPTASNIATLRNADVIFYNGLHLEGKLVEVLEQLERGGKPAHALSTALPPDRLLSLDNGGQATADPHIWGDAEQWASCVSVVVEGLAKADAAHAELYKQRGEALKQEYLALHTWAKERVATLPAENRLLITSHDAFNYFGRAYGLEVLGIQGLSTATEAGLADIARLADLIRARKVKSIFIESSVSPATIERLAKDSGAKIGGELFSDAMGTPGEIETVHGDSYDKGTYAGFIKHNINTAVEALK